MRPGNAKVKIIQTQDLKYLSNYFSHQDVIPDSDQESVCQACTNLIFIKTDSE